MKCGHVREYLIAFLDSELDSALSLEVQLHLDGCADCAREAEIERTVRKRLERALVKDGPTAPPHREALADLCATQSADESPGTGTRFSGTRFSGTARGRSWVRLGLVAAASVVIVTGTARYLVHQSPADPDRFVRAVVEDYTHFLDGGAEVQLASADRGVVMDWLRDKTSLHVSLPRSDDGHCTLLGARKCTLNGKPAAFAVYDMHGTPASLLVVEGGDVSGMRKVSLAGSTHWVARRDGYTIVACRRDELVYAAVSTFPEEELLCLMSDVVHESH